MSLKAKGLWGFVMTKPDSWDINVRGLAAQLKEDKDTIANILRELTKFGYYESVKTRGKDGKILWKSVMYDSPQPRPETEVKTKNLSQKTMTGFSRHGELGQADRGENAAPRPKKPDMENSPQVNTNKSKNLSNRNLGITQLESDGSQKTRDQKTPEELERTSQLIDHIRTNFRERRFNRPHGASA